MLQCRQVPKSMLDEHAYHASQPRLGCSCKNLSLSATTTATSHSACAQVHYAVGRSSNPGNMLSRLSCVPELQHCHYALCILVVYSATKCNGLGRGTSFAAAAAVSGQQTISSASPATLHYLECPCSPRTDSESWSAAKPLQSECTMATLRAVGQLPLSHNTHTSAFQQGRCVYGFHLPAAQAAAFIIHAGSMSASAP
jgi:hypothetical protein